jgi:thiol-disulfide isomerase/thioredoxin
MSPRHIACALLFAGALLGLDASATHEPRAFGPASLDAIRHAYKGRPFVLSLWSVHCEPCRHEMPMWNALQKKYPGVRVVLVAADNPGELDRIQRFLERHDPGPVESWRYADDFEERIRFAIDPKWRGELPRTYFFDADHQAVARTGVPDAQWTEKWFARVGAQARR